MNISSYPPLPWPIIIIFVSLFSLTSSLAFSPSIFSLSIPWHAYPCLPRLDSTRCPFPSLYPFHSPSQTGCKGSPESQSWWKILVAHSCRCIGGCNLSRWPRSRSTPPVGKRPIRTQKRKIMYCWSSFQEGVLLPVLETQQINALI